MDFTSVFLVNKPGEAVVVNDCIVVMESVNVNSGQRERINIDFICDDTASSKSDYHFVLTVWVKLFLDEKLNQRFDSIDVWSDGGPHHFKTRWCQFMWHALSTLRFDKKRITHHFFASYHGHSLADSHAATIKRVLRSQYNLSQMQRLCADTFVLFWGPANALELAPLLAHVGSNTRVHVLPNIDRDKERKPAIQGINLIKSKHCFRYQGGLCYAAELSWDDQPSQQFSFSPAKAKRNVVSINLASNS
jgi:hypothetical protein